MPQNHDLSPESSEFTSWRVWRVLSVLVKPREDKEDAEHLPGSSRDCASPTLKTSSLFCSFPHPFKRLAGVEVIFPVCPKSFGICLSRACLGRGHSSWLWCDKSCLPSSSVSTTTVPLWSASSPPWTLLPLCLPRFPRPLLLAAAATFYEHGPDGDSHRSSAEQVSSDQEGWKELLLGCSAGDEHLGRPVVWTFSFSQGWAAGLMGEKYHFSALRGFFSCAWTEVASFQAVVCADKCIYVGS